MPDRAPFSRGRSFVNDFAVSIDPQAPEERVAREQPFGNFVNGGALSLGIGPIPIEGSIGLSRNRAVDVIGYGRRILGY